MTTTTKKLYHKDMPDNLKTLRDYVKSHPGTSSDEIAHDLKYTSVEGAYRDLNWLLAKKAVGRKRIDMKLRYFVPEFSDKHPEDFFTVPQIGPKTPAYDEIAAYLKEYPKSTSAQIETNTDVNNVNSNLFYLCKTGKIVKEQSKYDGKYRYSLPTDAAVPMPTVERKQLRFDRMREFVTANPGKGAKEIGEEMGIDVTGVGAILRKLWNDGHITREKRTVSSSNKPIYVYFNREDGADVEPDRPDPNEKPSKASSIIKFIERNPGSTSGQIADALQLDKGNVNPVLVRSIRNGTLRRSKKYKQPYSYFPGAKIGKYHHRPEYGYAYKRIVEFVARHPGTTSKEIAAETDISEADVRGYLPTLVRQNRLTRKEGKNETDQPQYHYWVYEDEAPTKKGRDIGEAAREFYWETKSDSLHDFVIWYNGRQ